MDNELLVFWLLAVLGFAAIAIPIALSVWMLRQLDRAAKRKRVSYQNANIPKPPTRILIVDFFSLIFLLQIPFAIAMNSQEAALNSSLVSIMAVALLALVAVWWTTIRTVCEAGISSFRWRAIISMVVMPSAFIGCFLVPIGVFSFANSEVSSQTLFLTIISCIGLVVSPVIIVRALASAEDPVVSRELN